MPTPNTYLFIGSITAEQPLATCSKDLNDREGGDRLPTPVPHTQTAAGDCLYFPGTGIRGTLRRKALNVIHDILVEHTGQSTPLSLDQHYLLTLGGIKGSGATERSSVLHMDYWLARNPLLAAFGAGDGGALGFVTGHLQVGNAFADPSVKPAIFSGARTDTFYRNAETIKRLSDADVETLVCRAKGGREKSIIAAEVKTLMAQLRKHKDKSIPEAVEISRRLEELEAEAARVKEESGTSDVSIGMPLAGYKAIPQGSKLSHRMHLVRSNEIELGLILHSIKNWSKEPIVGAHSSTGCGMVSGEWEVFEPSDHGKKSLGTVKMEAFGGVTVIGEVLTRAMTAFTDYMDSKEYNFAIPTLDMGA